jgi:hypothetical protein
MDKYILISDIMENVKTKSESMTFLVPLEVNSDNAIGRIRDENTALAIVKDLKGMEFLAKIQNMNGLSVLDLAVLRFRSVAQEVTSTPEKIKLASETKDSNGWSVLHSAVRNHEIVAFKLIQDEESRNFLDRIKTNKGMSVLQVAREHHENVERKLKDIRRDWKSSKTYGLIE